MARIRISLFLMCFFATVAGWNIADAHAKKSIWAVLFPYHVKAEEDPADADLTETKQAPFVDPAEGTTPSGPLAELYDATGDGAGGAPLEDPHRHHRQVGIWLLKVISDTLTVDPDTYQEHLQNLSKILDTKALQDFDRFMRESRTLENLVSGGMTLTTFVEEDPLLLNNAPLGGRYRWLFETPVTLTFLPKGVNSYDNVEPISHKIMLRMQVGRIKPVEEGQEDIIVESFEVLRNDGG